MTLLEDFSLTVEEHNLVEQKDRILIGLSAGPDSVCLLHLLMFISQKYQLELGIAHINYHLRTSESDKEAEWVHKLSSEKQIPLHYKDSPIHNKANLQEKARKIRYHFFSEISKTYHYNKIALGHHLDDQVETFFHRLMRGSSLTGLVSMNYQTSINSMKIIRPLLNIPKNRIITYLKQKNLFFFIDSSNLKKDYLRNQIRIKLSPVIEEIFPNYRQKIQKTISHIREENQFIHQLVEDEINKITIFSSSIEKRINLKRFNLLHLTLRKRILIYLAREVGNMWNYFSTKTLNTLLDQIRNCKERGSQLIFEKGDIEIFIEYNYLTLYLKEIRNQKKEIKVLIQEKSSFRLTFSNALEQWMINVDTVELSEKQRSNVKQIINKKNEPLTIFLDREKLKNQLIIRCIKKGDKIFLSKNLGLKKVKKILINFKIPIRKRQDVFFLCDGEKPFGIISLPPFLMIRLSEEYYITDSSKNMLKLFMEKAEIEKQE